MDQRSFQKPADEHAVEHPLVDPEAPERSLGNRHVREAAFAARHPGAAMAIGRILDDPAQGYPGKLKPGALLQSAERTLGGGSNISTDASRLAGRIGLDERSTGAGSQVNAFRHVLWQATITARLGKDTAREIGYAHEDEPEAIHGVRALSEQIFVNADGEQKADQSIDLANNVIGREIGGSLKPTATLSEIAGRVLERFHTTGLWMIAERRGGYMQPQLTRLSDEQYRACLARLPSLTGKPAVASR